MARDGSHLMPQRIHPHFAHVGIAALQHHNGQIAWRLRLIHHLDVFIAQIIERLVNVALKVDDQHVGRGRMLLLP